METEKQIIQKIRATCKKVCVGGKTNTFSYVVMTYDASSMVWRKGPEMDWAHANKRIREAYIESLLEYLYGNDRAHGFKYTDVHDFVDWRTFAREIIAQSRGVV